MFYVYLLQSEEDGNFYIGQTGDLQKRLKRHNNGKVIATRSKRPWTIKKYETFETRDQARWREHTLKHNTSERKKFYGV